MRPALVDPPFAVDVGQVAAMTWLQTLADALADRVLLIGPNIDDKQAHEIERELRHLSEYVLPRLHLTFGTSPDLKASGHLIRREAASEEGMPFTDLLRQQMAYKDAFSILCQVQSMLSQLIRSEGVSNTTLTITKLKLDQAVKVFSPEFALPQASRQLHPDDEFGAALQSLDEHAEDVLRALFLLRKRRTAEEATILTEICNSFSQLADRLRAAMQ